MLLLPVIEPSHKNTVRAMCRETIAMAGPCWLAFVVWSLTICNIPGQEVRDACHSLVQAGVLDFDDQLRLFVVPIQE